MFARTSLCAREAASSWRRHVSFLAVAIAVVSASCESAGVEPGVGEDEIIWNVHHNITKDGMKVGEVTADSAHLRDSRVVFIRPRIEMRPGHGGPQPIEVHDGRAVLHARTGCIVVEGDLTMGTGEELVELFGVKGELVRDAAPARSAGVDPAASRSPLCAA